MDAERPTWRSHAALQDILRPYGSRMSFNS